MTMAESTATTRPPLRSVAAFVAVAVLVCCARPARCQAEKRLSSVQQQQQQPQYYDGDDGTGVEVIKSKIRSEPYSLQQDSSPQQQQQQQQQHGKQSDSLGSASTVYGEQYGGGVVDHQPLDEEAQESISSGSINNHRIPQYNRGGSPVPTDVVEGKNVGNRAVGNNYHHSGGVAGNHQAGTTAAGYAVDSSVYGGAHYGTQDLILDQNYQLDFKYHDYDKMTKFLRTTSSKFPNLTALYSIGKSVQGTCNVVTFVGKMVLTADPTVIFVLGNFPKGKS